MNIGVLKSEILVFGSNKNDQKYKDVVNFPTVKGTEPARWLFSQRYCVCDFSSMFILNLSMICSNKKNMDYYYSCTVPDKPLPGLLSAEELIEAN